MSTNGFAEPGENCSSCTRLLSIVEHYRAIIALMTISSPPEKLHVGPTSTEVYAPEVRTNFNYDGAAQCANEDAERISPQTAPRSAASSPLDSLSPGSVSHTYFRVWVARTQDSASSIAHNRQPQRLGYFPNAEILSSELPKHREHSQCSTAYREPVCKISGSPA